MRTALQTILRIIAQIIPSFLLPKMIKRDRFDVAYHVVSDESIGHIRHLYPIVPVAEFQEALTFLEKNFNCITYNQLHDYVFDQVPLPPRALHLSIDDGFTECFTVIRPILLELNIPCTFFLTIDWLNNQKLFFRHQASLCVHKASELTDEEQKEFFAKINAELNINLNSFKKFKSWILGIRTPELDVFNSVAQLLGIDFQNYLDTQKPYLTFEQIRQLHADGFTIGAHSLSHKKLKTATNHEMETEIVASCLQIQEITGQSVIPFSFPHSAWGVSRDFLADIRKRNPVVGLLFDSKDLREDVPFIINRVWAERPITLDRRLHSLPNVFAQAYRDAWVDGIMRKLR